MSSLNGRVDGLSARLPDSLSGVWVADHEGRFTEVNRAACRLLGYSESDYLRRRFSEIIKPDEAGRLEVLMADLARGDRIADTWDVRHADGSYVSLALTHTFTADGHWESIGRVADGNGNGNDEPTGDDRLAELEQQVRQRDEKLASLPVIEQAKGILMRDLRFDDDDAFGYLVSISQDTNVKLRTVAAQVVDSLRRCGISAETARVTFDELSDLRARLRQGRTPDRTA